jgi:nitroimidazol reductase NimA-like FMN-containing flavoprotein (pyridoxamine 5'-phosphate oxidase superfamily)
MEDLRATERTRIKRMPKRGSYDRAVINSIIDQALFCHVGFVHEETPYVIPTLHVRIGDRIYIHGSAASRMLRAAADRIPLCVTVTHIDGIVLARSAFHHSVNYRSAIILGAAEEVAGDAEKSRVLAALVDHVAPGRWSEVRPPHPKELAATSVLGLPITEASAKVRIGGPVDDEEDYALAVWAGNIPVRLAAGAPIPDERLRPGIAISPSVAAYRLPGERGDRNGTSS